MTDFFEKQKQPKKPDSLTSNEAKDLARSIATKFDDLKQARSQKEKKWNECVKAFLSQHNHEVSDIRKWRSQIYIPLSYEAATNIYSNIKRALFPTDSAFFTVESGDTVGSMYANLIKSDLLQQLDTINFITKFGGFLKQLVILGNSAAAIYWQKTIRKVTEKIDVPIYDEDGNISNYETQEQVIDKVIYDGPEFQTINIFDVVFDATQSDWTDGLVIHRTYRTIDQVKNNSVYKNTSHLEGISSTNSDPYIYDSSKAFEMQDQIMKQDNLVKLYSAYGDFKVGKKIYYDYIAVVANDEHLIRFEPNPYPDKPFIFCTYESVPNELYGTGAIEPGLGIQYLVNTFSNQKSDVMSLLINGMWVYVDDGIIDPEEIVAKPGALIPVKNPDNIRPIHPDNSVVLSYNEIAQLKAEFQEITGATKYFTGGPSIDFSKTATEVNALQSAGIVRFSEIIQNIEENAIKRALNLIYNYNKTFRDPVNNVKTTHNGIDHFLNSQQAYLNNDFKLRIVGANSSMSREIRVNKLMEFIGIAGSSQVIAQQVNVMELVRQLYRELGFKDEKAIFDS